VSFVVLPPKQATQLREGKVYLAVCVVYYYYYYYYYYYPSAFSASAVLVER